MVYNAANEFFDLARTAQEEKDMKIRKTCFDKSDVKHVRNTMKKSHRHSQLYVLAKVHKQVSPLPTRLVVGASCSTLFSISTMLDKILQPLLPRLPTCCSNSNQAMHRLNQTLKQLRSVTNSATRCYLSTIDAVTMHTNMLKDEVMTNINKLLSTKFMRVGNFPIDEIMEVLTITLDNNVFAFGDAFWKQLKGMAMETPVACVAATLFFAYHEIQHLLPKFSEWIMLYLRYIDDGLLLWMVNTSEPSHYVAFEHFLATINAYSYLNWTASPLSEQLNYLDLHLLITSNHELIASPCAKPFHLYQHITHHSAHPPGITKATITGMLFALWSHCTKKSACRQRVCRFYKKLVESNH